MSSAANMNLDYERSVKIADDVYWVGFYDKESGLHCNPYLIIDNDEAVVIDGGSRPHFPVVMMKILQTGISPTSIVGRLGSSSSVAIGFSKKKRGGRSGPILTRRPSTGLGQ